MTRSVSAVPIAAATQRPVDRIDAQVLQMFALVRAAVSGATDIFLAGDRQAARALRRRERLIDGLHEKTEKDVTYELLRGNADSARQQQLLVILRILPELERSGDLAEHIASHAAQGLREWLSPRARLLVAQMGALGSEMWAQAGDAYATANGAAADLLRARDDEIDDLHVSLTAELAAAAVSVPVAIQMALVARYFERLGDHAVNVTRRLEHPTFEQGEPWVGR
jgi:phosphate transport system protein